MKLVKQDDLSKQELPPQVQALIDAKRQQNADRVSSLGIIVAKKRDDAVAARRSSGIERIWKEDEEYYVGIDDANRSNHAFTKPMGLDGGLTTNQKTEDQKGECTAFFNITRQFVDSASARMGDILLPAGEWNFAIKPTPIADLEDIKGSTQPVVQTDGTPIQRKDGSVLTLGEFAREEQAEAEARVEKAEKRIHDFLTECQYTAEARKIIEDSAKIGTGVIRGCSPVMRKKKVMIDGVFTVTEKIAPASKRVDPRNAFPDPNCGDNIHNGSFFIERDYLSARQLLELEGVPGYKFDQIKKVIEEGNNKVNISNTDNKTKSDDRFEVWYYYGDLKAADVAACGVKLDDDQEEDLGEAETVPAVVVLVNDTVIKCYLNPLTSGEFPYDLMPWQPMGDSPWGIGVARQGRVSQDMLNASARTLMKNTGLSSAPQIIFKQGVIQPADGDYTLYGGKPWIATEDAEVDDIRKAFTLVDIPSKQNELIALIQLANKMMEDATGIAFLLQGQQGSAPDTVGGMELLHKNASALLRRIARVFDERITEPHIRRYYDWLLIHGNDEEKGDMEISAVGSSALVEREIQAMQALQILNMSVNPAFGLSPEKAGEEVLKAWRFEPSKFTLSDEEKQKMAEQQGTPPPAPAVEVAKIRAESAERIEAARLDMQEQMDANDLDRDTLHQQAVAERNRDDRELRMQEMMLNRELKMLEYANKHQVTLEQIKADLAGEAMKIRATKDLVANKAPASALPKPAVEPPGLAPAGESYTK